MSMCSQSSVLGVRINEITTQKSSWESGDVESEKLLETEIAVTLISEEGAFYAFILISSSLLSLLFSLLSSSLFSLLSSPRHLVISYHSIPRFNGEVKRILSLSFFLSFSFRDTYKQTDKENASSKLPSPGLLSLSTHGLLAHSTRPQAVSVCLFSAPTPWDDVHMSDGEFPPRHVISDAILLTSLLVPIALLPPHNAKQERRKPPTTTISIGQLPP